MGSLGFDVLSLLYGVGMGTGKSAGEGANGWKKLFAAAEGRS